ncbi:hypothetical protein BC937DRAFT_86487 [Endogone sp. FLAS-F59071]|nr:hypothetical protein BC937DRAFT_86487 [Endogone sp. FLAS-F59071]|eukprot:RUS13016.1 hypothetical protein BC937DRAFT_86487 [Endogone sp. FLAS-F59071]
MKYIALLVLIVALATVVLGQSSSAATGDYIYITAPIGTSVFTAGKTSSITWKYTSGAGAPTNVSIDLLNNGVLISSIATGVKASGGKYSWAIPATEPSSYYYSIRISDPTTNYRQEKSCR